MLTGAGHIYICVEMRDRIVFILPFIQVVIAVVTLYRLPEPPPQYHCQIAQDTYGQQYNFFICNPR